MVLSPRAELLDSLPINRSAGLRSASGERAEPGRIGVRCSAVVYGSQGAHKILGDSLLHPMRERDGERRRFVVFYQPSTGVDITTDQRAGADGRGVYQRVTSRGVLSGTRGDLHLLPQNIRGRGTPGVHTAPLLRPTGTIQPVRLRAAQALAAVQALVASAVADGDLPAVGAGRGVRLEMGNGIVEGRNRPSMD